MQYKAAYCFYVNIKVVSYQWGWRVG